MPWNPSKVKTKKLIPGELYNPPEPLPLVEADKSFMEVTPSMSNEDATDEPSGEQQVEQQSEKQGEKPMVITTDKKTFKLVEGKEEKTDEEKMNEVFTLPKPKKMTKMAGCHIPGLLRCISSQAFQDKVHEIKDRKKAKRDEIEKRKAERKAVAEQKKEEKRKAAKARKAEKAAKRSEVKKWPQHRKWQRQQVEESSSSNDDEDVEYNNSSSEMSINEEEEDTALMNHCSECGQCFMKGDRNKAVGCDTEYCGQWYHPGCTDIDFEGKSETQIHLIDFVCKHC